MKWANAREICLMTLFTLLCIACFPINPLVLTGILEPDFYLPLFIVGVGSLGYRHGAGYGTNYPVSAPWWCPQWKIICPYHSNGGYGYLRRCQAPAIQWRHLRNIRYHIVMVSALVVRSIGLYRCHTHIPEYQG